MKEYRGILTNQSIIQSNSQSVNPNKTKKVKTKNYDKAKEKKAPVNWQKFAVEVIILRKEKVT